MHFNLPPLTNMSDTDYSVQERFETMYTVEVGLPIEHSMHEKEGDRQQITSNQRGKDRYDGVGWHKRGYVCDDACDA